jgi:hypothetical protein
MANCKSMRTKEEAMRDYMQTVVIAMQSAAIRLAGKVSPGLATCLKGISSGTFETLMSVRTSCVANQGERAVNSHLSDEQSQLVGRYRQMKLPHQGKRLHIPFQPKTLFWPQDSGGWSCQVFSSMGPVNVACLPQAGSHPSQRSHAPPTP